MIWPKATLLNLCLIALGLLGGPAHTALVWAQPQAHLQPSAISSEDALRVPARGMTLTISGGVSKGSYQAGLSHGMVYLMRWTGEHPTARQALQLPRFELAAATGSSAGNINALLAAVSWCDAQLLRRNVTESLFWQIWMPVGVERLFPEERPSMPQRPDMVLSRTFFDEVLYFRLRDALKRAARVGCAVPVGLTLTRTDRAGTAHLTDNGLAVPTMRYVSIAQLTAVRPGHMAFRPYPFDGLDRRQFGELALPLLGDAEVDSTGGARAMMDASLASSAFPVAFAPVEVAFRSEPRGEKEFGFFFDGGVFDNNPLALARSLCSPRTAAPDEATTRLAHATMAPRAVGAKQVSRIALSCGTPDSTYSVLIDEDNDRKEGQPGTGRRASEQSPARIGLQAYAPFIRNAVTAARTYELEVLSRDLDASERKRLLPTTRYHAITGSSLAGFGAFLSRVFREHDFYVGVYDAAYHIATHSRAGERELDQGRRVRRLLEAGASTRTLEAQAFLLWLHEREFGSGGRCTDVRRTGSVSNIYMAVACAAAQWEHESSGDVLGIAPLFRSLTELIPRDQFLAEERARCMGGVDRYANRYTVYLSGKKDAGHATSCSTGEDCAYCEPKLLRNMMKDPDQTIAELLEAGLALVRQNEANVRSETGNSAGTYVEAAYFLQRHRMMGIDTGFSWDNSSMPSTRLRGLDPAYLSERTLWRYLAPREIFFSMRNGGWGVGYRPRYRHPQLFHATGLGVTGALTYVNYGDAPDRLLLGTGIEWTPQRVMAWWPNIFLRNAEARVTFTAPDGPMLGEERPTFGQSIGLELSFYLLQGKLRFATHPPALFRGEPWEPGDNWAFTLGLSDVNGISYWLWHLVQ